MEILLSEKRGENFDILLGAKRGENFEILLRAKRRENFCILRMKSEEDTNKEEKIILRENKISLCAKRGENLLCNFGRSAEKI